MALVPPIATTATPDAGVACAFGPFVLDERGGRLLRDGAPVPLLPKDLAVLAHLVAHPGRLIAKDELLDAVWGHRHVTESVLKTVVSRLRAALGDDARRPAYIETAARRGYRFVAALRAPRAEAAAGAPAPGNLPAVLPHLHGRVGDIAALCRLFEAQRWVTLAGPGGIGKTRLAEAVAQQLRPRFPGGVWLVELAALADGAAVPASVAHALGLPAKGALATPDGLARALAAQAVLIVLDNAEHLADAVSLLTEALLAHAPRAQVLVTSQAPLRGRGESVYRLHGLRVPAPAGAQERRRMARPTDAARTLAQAQDGSASNAVSLFVERVQALLPGFAPAADQAGEVLEICRRLDGIPLALELAAARVPLLGLAGVRERLDDRLRLLTRGSRGAPARQQTLAQALQWTFELLQPLQQTVWRRLGVFAGSFTLPAAQRVAGDGAVDDWAVLDALDALVDHALVHTLPPPTPVAPVRYRLLESPRAFALAQLREAGELAAVRRRHAESTLAALQALSAQWLDLPTFDWQQLVLPELDNLRSAFAWAREAGDAGLRVALAAWGTTLWLAAGAPREALEAIDAVAGEVQAAAPAAQARYWHSIAQLGTAMLVPPERGYAAAQRAVQASAALGDSVGRYWALSYLVANAQFAAGAEFDKAATLAQMRALEQPDWPPLRGRPLRFALALDDMLGGQWPACRDRFRAEYELALRLGDLRTAWLAGSNLAHALLVLDEPAEAARVTEQVVAQARGLGRLRIAWGALGTLGVARLTLGELDAAESALRELLEISVVDGTLWWAADFWPALLLLRGEVDAAARACGLADAVQQRLKKARGALPAKVRERTLADLRERLGAQCLARRLAEGAAWHEEQLVRAVRGELPA